MAMFNHFHQVIIMVNVSSGNDVGKNFVVIVFGAGKVENSKHKYFQLIQHRIRN